MTSASDIIRLRCLLGALSLSESTFFANSFSSSLQKSSAMQKISVILSLLIISNLFFCFTIKLLIINELAKGKTNYFCSFYPIFFYAILIPNSRFEEVTSTDYAGHSVVFASSNTDNKHYATLNLPFATTIPEGVTAYKKVGDTGASVKLDVYKNANEVLPANTPVLLQTANTFATFAPAPYVAQEATGFSGTLAPTAVTGNAYILANDGGAVKFCKLSTTKNTVNPNKAYLTLPAASATALNFDFGGVATGIENAVAEKANNAPIYDLSGRRVMNAVKGGIYIQNGKKFVK